VLALEDHAAKIYYSLISCTQPDRTVDNL